MENTIRILDLIGNTPLMNIKENVFAKLEFLNPTGSIKDRMASFMLEAAEKNNEVKPGYEIVEATSGNTGISFAMIAAVKGYRFTAIMPETMSTERRQMMQAYGANIILERKMEDAVNKLEDFIVRKDVWLPRQFANFTNVDCHRETTGEELSQQLEDIGAFVAGVGTGGTLMGVAEALKKRNPNVRIIAVEPSESPVLSGGQAGPHKIQGIGSGFIPKILDMKKIDTIIKIGSDEAMEMSRKLAREDGLFVGISSGANLLASLKIAKEMPNKKVATILPDSAGRYLSMGLFTRALRS